MEIMPNYYSCGNIEYVKKNKKPFWYKVFQRTQLGSNQVPFILLNI